MGVREGLANWRRRLWSEGGQGRLLRSLATGATLWPEATAFSFSPVDEDFRLKALLVAAHPDDESECAAVLYRITHELGGTVDQVVVTNGEAGHQYSAPAEAYYRLSLNEQEAGRKRLARVRRWEVIRASRILGIRHSYFFEQKDTGLTFDVRAGFQAWDLDRIHRQLFRLLDSEEYDLVFVLLPSPDTHGHHQAVAQLTLEAVANLKPEDRPAVLGARTVTAASTPEDFSELDGYPLTRTISPEPAWSFDRRTPLGCQRALDYNIVVNWVIAEHKSQGIFQMEYGRRTHEYFWLFEAGGVAGFERWNDFLCTIRQHSRPRVEVEEEFAQGFFSA